MPVGVFYRTLCPLIEIYNLNFFSCLNVFLILEIKVFVQYAGKKGNYLRGFVFLFRATFVGLIFCIFTREGDLVGFVCQSGSQRNLRAEVILTHKFHKLPVRFAVETMGLPH